MIKGLEMVDIRTHDFQVGNCVIMNDINNAVVIFFVERVEMQDEGLKRVLHGKIYATTNPNLHISDDFTLTLVAYGNPVLGRVIPTKEAATQILSQFNNRMGVPEVLAYEIIMFIKMKSTDSRFQQLIKDIAPYLQKMGFLRAEDTYEQHKKEIKKIVTMFPQYFEMRGPYVRLTQDALTNGSVKSSGTTNSNSNVKIVDKQKLFDGISLILESGIFGEIDFKWSR